MLAKAALGWPIGLIFLLAPDHLGWGGPGWWIGVGIIVLASLGVAVALVQLAGGKAVWLLLDEEGLTDLRLGDRKVPWAAVRDIRLLSVDRAAVLVLVVDPDLAAGLDTDRVSSSDLGRKVAAKLDISGLPVRLDAASVPAPEIIDRAFRFWHAAHGLHPHGSA